MRAILLWLLTLPVALAFLVAGMSKGIYPEPTLGVFSKLGVPQVFSQGVLSVIPPLEFAVGLALLFNWTSRWVFAASVATLAMFVCFLIWLAIKAPSVECSCFGSMLNHWTQGGPASAIGRNLILLACLAWPTYRSFRWPMFKDQRTASDAASPPGELARMTS